MIERNRAWLAPGFRWPTVFVGSWTRDRIAMRGNQIGAGITPFEQR